LQSRVNLTGRQTFHWGMGVQGGVNLRNKFSLRRRLSFAGSLA
jgi:hypothetical protein